MDEHIEPNGIVKAFQNVKLIEVCAYIIASLESNIYQHNTKVFRTQWASKLFNYLFDHLGGRPIKDWTSLDDWYAGYLKKFGVSKCYEVSPSMTFTDVNINWIDGLMLIENYKSGFLLVLHNVLKLENQSRDNLKTLSMNEFQPQAFDSII